MNKMLQLCLMVLLIQFSACCICHKGHKSEFKGAFICNKCDPGTFMPEDNHNKTECYPCTKLRDANTKVLIRECNREEDALIVCKPGFFRDGNTCRVCKVCEAGYEIQACNGDRNTACCRSDISYIRVNSDGVKVCSPRTLPCKQGQFLVSGNMCQPCQPGTYMVENHHNSTICRLCQQIPENQEIDGYVATICTLTRKSAVMSNAHDKPVLDKAAFNCSHLSGHPNSTDHACSAPSVRTSYVAPIILLLLKAVVINAFIFWSGHVKLTIRRSNRLLSMLNCFSDKKKCVRKHLATTFELISFGFLLYLGGRLMGSLNFIIFMAFELALLCLVLAVITIVIRLMNHYEVNFKICTSPRLKRDMLA